MINTKAIESVISVKNVSNVIRKVAFNTNFVEWLDGYWNSEYAGMDNHLEWKWVNTSPITKTSIISFRRYPLDIWRYEEKLFYIAISCMAWNFLNTILIDIELNKQHEQTLDEFIGSMILGGDDSLERARMHVNDDNKPYTVSSMASPNMLLDLWAVQTVQINVASILKTNRLWKSRSDLYKRLQYEAHELAPWQFSFDPVLFYENDTLRTLHVELYDRICNQVQKLHGSGDTLDDVKTKKYSYRNVLRAVTAKNHKKLEFVFDFKERLWNQKMGDLVFEE